MCKELFPAIEKIVKRDDWTFAQDGAPSHPSHLVQDFLKTKLKRRFIHAEDWPSSSPNVNPLDYFYWDFVKIKVYQGRSEKPLISEAELKKKKNLFEISVRMTWYRYGKQSNNLSPNESCGRKTRRAYQNVAWVMLLHKNSSLYLFLSLCKKIYSIL